MGGAFHTTDANGAAIELFRRRLLTMQIVHAALVAGVTLFGGVVLFIAHEGMTFDFAFRNPLVLVAAVLAAAAISASSVMHMLFFRGGAAPADVPAAVQKYQVFVLARAAVIEGAALFSAVATLVSRNMLPTVLLALCTVALAVRRPSQREFMRLMAKGPA